MKPFSFFIATGLISLLAFGCGNPGPSHKPLDGDPGTGNAPSSGTGGASAMVDGEPSATSATSYMVKMKATGPTIASAEDAARLEAAKAVCGKTVRSEAFADAEWKAKAMAATTVSNQGKKNRVNSDGMQELERVIEVNQGALQQWAEGKNYLTDVNSQLTMQPTIMVVPDKGAGKWPNELTSDQSDVESGIRNFLTTKGLEFKDYKTWFEAVEGQLKMQTGSAQIEENFLIGGDMYMQYRVEVDESRPGRVKAKVHIKGILTTTADVAFDDMRYSRELAIGDRNAAIKEAATDAAGAAYLKLYERFQKEYATGVPYILVVRGIRGDDEKMAIYDAAKAVSERAAPKQQKFQDGIITLFVKAKNEPYSNEVEFESALKKGLKDKGFVLRDFFANSRFMTGELAKE